MYMCESNEDIFRTFNKYARALYIYDHSTPTPTPPFFYMEDYNLEREFNGHHNIAFRFSQISMGVEKIF